MNKDKKPLSETHPELAKEANGWDPENVFSGNRGKLEWKCSKGHIWLTRLDHRTQSESGCPICANQKVLAGFNDLATTHPELAKEAYGWEPTTVISGGGKKLDWKCSLGHIWQAKVDNRKNGKGCPYCSNKIIHHGFNDLATTHPELAKEAYGWDPKAIFAGATRKLKWMCENGHTWFAPPNSRSTNKSGCPVCVNQEVLAGFNDLATTHPELAKEAYGWEPRTTIAGTEKKLKWKCASGHTWEATCASRSSGGKGCPFCSHRLLLADFNDLATTHPELAKEAYGWDPSTVMAGTTKKLVWKCQLGHVWNASGNSRMTSKTNCPSCALTGFDPNLDGYVYFLVQPKWEIYQIGITNFPDKRLKSHAKNGFELLELRGPIDGHTAKELETALLRFLKSQKADLSPEQIAGKFDGYTESWTMDSYKVNNLKELIDKASEAGF